MRFHKMPALVVLLVLMTAALVPQARAQGGQVVYDDALENGWQNYGWATLNYSNTSPVHTGTDSISVSATGYQALYLDHADFDSTPYLALTFWIHGGTSGGQTLQVQALVGNTAQAAFVLPALAANTWQQVTIPLATLGASAKPNLDGFWIKNTSGGTLPTFYVDDISLTGAPQPTSAHLSVNAGSVVRTLDGRVYGLNTAIWDGNLGTPASVSLLGQMGTQLLRYPGGSASDVYDWTTNRSDGATYAWASSFTTFAALAQTAHSQACITVNYGSGTPEMAAAWVAYANGSPGNAQTIGVDARGRDWKTVGYWASLRAATPLATDDGLNFLRVGQTSPFGFHDWEVGNECYGSWENDQHGVSGSGLTGTAHDPYTYAQYAAQFYQKMKSVDQTIQVGVVGYPGEDAGGDGQHAVPNPNESGSLHSGWTPVVLATLAGLNVTPDFLIYHRYPEGPGSESDAGLLTDSGGAGGWAVNAADLRRMLTDYAGTGGSGVQILATENNSVYGNPGKQSVSLVNGLYLADSIGSLAQTEIDSLIWWDFRNGSSTANNNSTFLYGWRLFGDYGLVASGDRSDTPVNTPFPPFYAAKLLTHWARGGDRIVSASSDYSLLSVYAAKLSNGSLALLVINKDPSRDLTGHIALTGFAPGSTTATVYRYGKPEDLASADLTQTTLGNAGAAFDAVFPSYSMSVVVLSAPVVLPTIATAASATPAPVTGRQTGLSVLGADAAGESTLTYTWSATGPAAVAFSPNGTNAAKNAVASFAAAGSYVLTATVSDSSGHSVQSAVTVMVNQTLSQVTVTPASVTLNTGQTQQFAAAGTDQFGAAMPVTPTWSVPSAAGTISAGGLFTAAAPGGPYTVTATLGAATGTAQATVTAPAAQTLFQINAGGPAVGTFAADGYYSGGTAAHTTAAVSTAGVTDPAPQAVYQTERYGNFTYAVPGLTPGAAYTLRLHFTEIYWNSAGQRLFNVSVNGSPALTNFDVFAAAGGKDRGIVETLPVTADGTGRITVTFTTLRDNAKVSGIEVLGAAATPPPPGTPAYQINTGGGAAGTFAADGYYSGGTAAHTTAAVSTAGVTDPAPQAVYQTERYGNFTYAVPGLTPGAAYTLRLHFTEIYWNSAGQRLFNVSVNGSPALTNFDVFAAAGGKDRGIVETLPVTADGTGRITVTFTTLRDNAKVSGIELTY